VGNIFKVPPAPAVGFNGPAFTLGADIDTLLAQLYTTDATYTEAAMSFMTPPHANDLSDVRRRGAKMIVYQGVSDPIFSINDTKAWFKGLDRHSGGDVEDFARLYPVPGMGHCSGGPATDQADFITPLVAWVERGRAPGSLVATARGAGNAGGVNAELPAAWSAQRTRPLCPYPSVAHYKGHGDLESASSFTCRPAGDEHHGH
jgi:feruloyl esterase